MSTLAHAKLVMKSPMAAGSSRSPVAVTELLTLAKAGDVTAFERLYRIHVGRVHAVCLRMTADVDRAEHATQEAFVRAWEKLNEHRDEASFSTWLHRIAVNAVLQSRRSELRRVEREQRSAVRAESASSTAQTADGALDLEHAIARLPERARWVLVMHDLEGYRHREIAQLLGVSEGTSKAQLHRARTRLKEMLQ
jgi:RNA polymerase sigma-70 factor (ECF subfamily)